MYKIKNGMKVTTIILIIFISMVSLIKINAKSTSSEINLDPNDRIQIILSQQKGEISILHYDKFGNSKTIYDEYNNSLLLIIAAGTRELTYIKSYSYDTNQSLIRTRHQYTIYIEGIKYIFGKYWLQVSIESGNETIESGAYIERLYLGKSTSNNNENGNSGIYSVGGSSIESTTGGYYNESFLENNWEIVNAIVIFIASLFFIALIIKISKKFKK